MCPVGWISDDHLAYLNHYDLEYSFSPSEFKIFQRKYLADWGQSHFLPPILKAGRFLEFFFRAKGFINKIVYLKSYFFSKLRAMYSLLRSIKSWFYMKTACALFFFNRPRQTANLLDSLRKCNDVDSIDFYAFVDGKRNIDLIRARGKFDEYRVPTGTR